MENQKQGERLNKFLASCGLGSRRHCEALIQAGLVIVDGKVVTDLGRRVDPSTQTIQVEGEKLTSQRKMYYLLNKPKGVYCTNSPEEKRQRAIDLIKDPKAPLLHSVGRLDADSEGLLLLTNDGEFTNHLTHPRYGVPKTYYVKVHGKIPGERMERLRRGVHLAEGRTGPLKVFVKKRAKQFTVLLVTLREGKNREIRRIFARLGFAVQELKRVRIGALSLSGMSSGSYRRLSPAEVKSLLESGAREKDDASENPG